MQPPAGFLSPNLHSLVCQLVDEMEASGDYKANIELWMERSMQDAKRRSSKYTTLNAEATGLQHDDLTAQCAAPSNPDQLQACGCSR